MHILPASVSRGIIVLQINKEMALVKRIVCFGDSNTYGFAAGIGGRFDDGARWSGILKKSLAKKNIEVIEEGMNGRTTVFDDPTEEGRNGSDALGHILKKYGRIDMIIIMLGTNDCKVKFGADAKAIAQGMDVLISMIKLFDTNINVLLISPAEINEGVRTGWFAENFDDTSIEKSKRLADEYRELARRRGCVFLNASDHVKTDSFDGIHLNKDAHKELARVVEDAVTEALRAEYGG